MAPDPDLTRCLECSSLSYMTTYASTATRDDIRLIDAAGGNIERACSLLSCEREGFDGERVIEATAHLRLTQRLGFPTGYARQRLEEAQAEEDRWMAEWHARQA